MKLEIRTYKIITVENMKKLGFKSGTVEYNEFHIDFSKSFSEQVECLTEDLLQVRYAENLLLDVGWYSEYEENGYLIIQVILDGDWDKPIYKEKSKDAIEFVNNLQKAVRIAEEVKAVKKGLEMKEHDNFEGKAI